MSSHVSLYAITIRSNFNHPTLHNHPSITECHSFPIVLPTKLICSGGILADVRRVQRAEICCPISHSILWRMVSQILNRLCPIGRQHNELVFLIGSQCNESWLYLGEGFRVRTPKWIHPSDKSLKLHKISPKSMEPPENPQSLEILFWLCLCNEWIYRPRLMQQLLRYFNHLTNLAKYIQRGH